MNTYRVSITYRTLIDVEKGTGLDTVKDMAIDSFMDFVRDGGDCNDIESFIQVAEGSEG